MRLHLTDDACVQGTRRRANRPKQAFRSPGTLTDDDGEDGEEKLAVVGAHSSHDFLLMGFYGYF